MKEVERRFRERLQPFFDQDIQVLVELERKQARLLNEMNRRMVEIFINGRPGYERRTYKL